MSEEEKNVETIIDEIEAENDTIIEPETEDDVKEAFEINKEYGPAAALGAPLIRALGDPEPADPNMIQKHLDNFLAKIAGETPIDENVRDSTEYWLNRISEAGGTKPLYLHRIRVSTTAVGYLVTDNPEAYTTATFSTYLHSIGAVSALSGVPIVGAVSTEDNTFSIKAALFSSSGSNNVRMLQYIVTLTITDGVPAFTSEGNSSNVSITDEVTPI